MTSGTPMTPENGAPLDAEPQGGVSGHTETNGQQSASMDVSGGGEAEAKAPQKLPQSSAKLSKALSTDAEGPPVPSASVPVTVIPEVLAIAPDGRETVKVHPSAPEADRSAVEEWGLTWDIPAVCPSCSKEAGGYWRKANGKRICGAHPIWARGPCKQDRIYDNGRCRLHNGQAARGMAAPRYEHGRWAKAFGERGSAYTEARDDPELMNMHRTVGALDVLVQESMERRDALDTPNFRSDLRKLWTAYRAAIKKDDDAEALELLDDIGKLIRRGASQDDANEAIARNVSRMAKHVEAHWKIEGSSGQSVNKAMLLAVIESIVDVMIQEVPPEHARPILLAIDRQVFRGQLAWAGIDAASGGQDA